MKLAPYQMCFGLDQSLDRQSCSTFLQLLGSSDCAETLAARMSSEEITELVGSLTAVLKQHFSEDEYHTVFLMDKDHQPHDHNHEE